MNIESNNKNLTIRTKKTNVGYEASAIYFYDKVAAEGITELAAVEELVNYLELFTEKVKEAVKDAKRCGELT